MGKRKIQQTNQKRTSPSLAGPNALPVFVVIMIAVFIGIALLPFPKKELGCNDHVAQAQYPPSMEFTPSQAELDRLLAGYTGTDPGDYFHWILGILQDSSLPIASQTTQFLVENQQDISFIFQPLSERTLGLVRPNGDLIEFYIDHDTITNPNGGTTFLLMMTIVHEAVHVEQYLVEGSRIAEEQGIPIGEAYQQIYDLHEVDAEQFICWEMEAFARETAYYKQMKQAGFVNIETYFDGYLNLLEELEWNWKASEWAEYIRNLTDKYKHEIPVQ